MVNFAKANLRSVKLILITLKFDIRSRSYSSGKKLREKWLKGRAKMKKIRNFRDYRSRTNFSFFSFFLSFSLSRFTIAIFSLVATASWEQTRVNKPGWNTTRALFPPPPPPPPLQKLRIQSRNVKRVPWNAPAPSTFLSSLSPRSVLSVSWSLNFYSVPMRVLSPSLSLSWFYVKQRREIWFKQRVEANESEKIVDVLNLLDLLN